MTLQHIPDNALARHARVAHTSSETRHPSHRPPSVRKGEKVRPGQDSKGKKAKVSQGEKNAAYERRGDLRETSQRLTDSKRIKGCGVHPVAGAGAVTLVHGGHGSARFSGLQSCKSVWLCPVCAAKIAASKADQLKQCVTNHAAQGGAVVLMTLTVSHTITDTLEDVANVVRLAWGDSKKGLTSDKAWKGAHGIRKRYGITLPPVWGLEVTAGENGWHPHRHVLLFVDSPLSKDQLSALQADMYGVWRRKVTNLGMKAPHPIHGVDVKQAAAGQDQDAANMAAYVAKGNLGGIADEVTFGQLKTGDGKKTATTFEILGAITDAYQAGQAPHAQDVARWLEFGEWVGSGNQTQMWFPPKLRRELGVSEKTEDQMIEDGDTAEDVTEPVGILGIPVTEWRAKLARNRPLQAELKQATARGKDAIAAYLYAVDVLERHGITYQRLMVPMSREDHDQGDGLPTHTEAVARDMRRFILG